MAEPYEATDDFERVSPSELADDFPQEPTTANSTADDQFLVPDSSSAAPATSDNLLNFDSPVGDYGDPMDTPTPTQDSGDLLGLSTPSDEVNPMKNDEGLPGGDFDSGRHAAPLQPSAPAVDDFDPFRQDSGDAKNSFMNQREATPPPSDDDMEETPLRQPSPAPVPDSPTEIKKEPEPAVASTTSEVEKPVELPKQALQPNPQLQRGATNCTSCCAWLKSIDPRVWDVLLWRKPQVTGPILAVFLLILFTLTCCSSISVVSNLALTVLTTAFAVRMGKYVMVRVHKGEDVHPFQDLLSCDFTVSEQKIEEMAVEISKHVSQALSQLVSLIFVRDITPSLKFGVVLYVMTIIGSWFNGLTLVILAVIAVFTLPKIYDTHKGQIDQYVDVMQNKFHDVYRQLQDKVPYLKQKTQ